jgi:hypothetical protein
MVSIAERLGESGLDVVAVVARGDNEAGWSLPPLPSGPPKVTLSLGDGSAAPSLPPIGRLGVGGCVVMIGFFGVRGVILDRES